MAKRFQHGSLQRKKRGGRLVWLGLWNDVTGRKRCKLLGTVAEMTKGTAQEALNALVRPVNEQRQIIPYAFGSFVTEVVYPAQRRRTKTSTQDSTEDRINRLIIPHFSDDLLTSFDRTKLQDFLDKLASTPIASERERDDGRLRSASVIAHVRWDLRLIFKYAVNEGILYRNPADLLYIPGAPTAERYVLSLEQATIIFRSFPLRERLVVKLCGLLGLRPGEAFALQWADVTPDGLRVRRRFYRGTIDTPKSKKGNRLAALSNAVLQDLNEWRRVSLHTAPDDWIFASENRTPLWPTNVWWDKIRPTMVELGMPWVTYQVLRRSTATLLNALGVDGAVVARQLGHGLDVSQNVYSLVSVARQQEAINKLEAATTPPNPKQAASARNTANGILRNTSARPARKALKRITNRAKGLSGAGDRGRTGDVQLGKLAFYH